MFPINPRAPLLGHFLLGDLLELGKEFGLELKNSLKSILSKL